MDNTYYSPSNKDDHQYTDDEDDVQLPGFRFHPTDEELVDFYLRRKIQKKPISLELIKSIDIYKYDPWDLPKTAGDTEWYFFCKRGRKYKNSIRPNRVTGSGFWKATGIDKPIHSHGGEGHACSGLKKTLVYYRGSAGKGSKTEWMMHEFRLPNSSSSNEHNNRSSDPKNMNTDPQQEAEIWTLCRIFKRNVSYRKYTPDWTDLSAAKRHPTDTVNSKKFATDRQDLLDQSNTYISFGASDICYEEKPLVNHTNNINSIINGSHQLHAHAVGQLSSNMQQPQLSSNMQQPQLSSNMQQPNSTHPYMDTFSNFSFQDLENDLLNENWDELRSVVQQLAFDPTPFPV